MTLPLLPFLMLTLVGLQPPAQGGTAVSGACTLVTATEAAEIMGAVSRAPGAGAFAPNTCAIQSESSPASIYMNITLDTTATLQAQGMPDARAAFDGMKRGIDDAEALEGVGDAAFFSKKNNGLYIVKGTNLASVLISPELVKRDASVTALKKLAAAIAKRM